MVSLGMSITKVASTKVGPVTRMHVPTHMQVTYSARWQKEQGKRGPESAL